MVTGLPLPSKQGYYQVIAFDGGGTTGWAHFIVDSRVFADPRKHVADFIWRWSTGEFEGTPHEIYTAAIDLVHRARYGKMPFLGHVAVVAEDFDLVQTVGGEDLLTVPKFNAVLAYECDKQFGLEVDFQKRTLRLGVTPDRLNLMGLDSPWNNKGRWSKSAIPGKDSFAAMQHGITKLKRVKRRADERPWTDHDMRNGQFSYPITGRGNKVRATRT